MHSTERRDVVIFQVRVVFYEPGGVGRAGLSFLRLLMGWGDGHCGSLFTLSSDSSLFLFGGLDVARFDAIQGIVGTR